MAVKNDGPSRILAARGKALWVSLQDTFEFDVQETALLLEACRTLDTIDALSVAIVRDGLMLQGSTGQPVLNGAVAELRQQQASYARLVAQLNLVDDEQGAAITARSRAAKTAAQSRWRERKAAQRG